MSPPPAIVRESPTASDPLDALVPRNRPIAVHACAFSDAAIRVLDGREVCWVNLVGDGHGAIGAPSGRIAARAVDDAASVGFPVVVRFRAASCRPDEGIDALDGWGRLARALAAASGVVPTVGIIDGSVASGLSLVVGLLDAVIMVRDSTLYISGPTAVQATTGRRVSADQLGGAASHSISSGLPHVVADDLADAVAATAELLSFLPSNNVDGASQAATMDPPDRLCHRLAGLVPDDARAGYDVRDVIAEVFDDHDFLETRAGFGRAMVCGFGRLAGVSVGVIANQPAHLAGAIDIPASQKAARFVQWCDAFGLPIVTFVDTPGYLPGRDLEWDGMIRHGGQLAFAYAEASVPRLCVILRKAYGGAYIVMDCKSMGNDLCVAWPGAEIAVMGAAGAVQITAARSLAGLASHDAESARVELEAAYAAEHLNPHRAAERGDVDEIIDPTDTRAVLCAALPSLLGKRREPIARKHRNGPL